MPRVPSGDPAEQILEGTRIEEFFLRNGLRTSDVVATIQNHNGESRIVLATSDNARKIRKAQSPLQHIQRLCFYQL